MARILVIDDNEDVRSFLRFALAGRAGHQVEEAANGPLGLAAARRQPVDLVFCDLCLPGSDGLEVIRGLRRDCPGLPVVVISGGDRQEVLDRLAAAGSLRACWVLAKPFGSEELLAVLAQVLGAAPARPQEPRR